MKLRTSYFNGTVLKKDITRFAPSWALYLTGMLLIMVGDFAAMDLEPKSLASDINVTISILSVANLFYALLNAQLLFGDLFNSRNCNALHAMPLRREGWFLTHLVSGMLFSAVPNLIVGLCLIPSLDFYASVALIWAGCLTMQYVFFFGTAVFSAMCTGSRFAMALVYGIINFLSALVWGLLTSLYQPLLHGITINTEGFDLFSPVWYLCSREMRYVPEAILPDYYRASVNGMPYLWAIFLIGAALLTLSLLLYRRRHLESAGDFIAIKPLAPVFAVLYTLVAGIVLHIFTTIFGTNDNYIFLAVGIIAGYITGQMLLKRTVRVFQGRTFLGLALMAALVFGSLGLAKMDVLGIVTWVPAPAQVQSVTINSYYYMGYTTEDPAEIRELTEIHGDILADCENTQGFNTRVVLSYVLNNGKTVNRDYYFSMSEDTADKVNSYLSKPEVVMQYEDWETFRESVTYVFIPYKDLTFYAEEARTLVDAIKADCEAGNMNPEWSMHSKDKDYSLVEIGVKEPDAKDIFRSVTIWDNCEHTIAWLEDHGVEYYAG